ncbi:MAG: TerB family tellurite resistance protein [Bacteroidales bacterium]|nr:TerB family tellurite resistance protein [Bacteroidales bacterium]
MLGVIAGILGWIFSGSFWIGLLCFFAGRLIDSALNSRVVIHHHRQSRADFDRTFLILCAEVMKADNSLMRSELDCVKNYLLQQLGPEKASEALLQLRDILKENYSIEEVCAEVRNRSTIYERLITLKFLFDIAQADGTISVEELSCIQRIASNLNISRMDFESLKAMYMGGYQYSGTGGGSSYTAPRVDNLDNDYRILEISPDATDEEVKKAYRELAKKHHPDKVNHLGDDVRKAAEEKFARLNQAYERIKKARGMN